ncbi:threonylcarbamoyl-AMP synthase [Candidatus Kaiserbacteria bacterium CG10_big_fil_rev_8_21_14_0_10_51_14]|uniref:L-threonylcarbamoyladenylate synthase n=1 Tax=Candidatus Kaiserbacteria bacterium CG10_big_fil_rev_8_21_14_0_10_51_14 TaxID=1974610 RepID=A0A2H0UBE2_9BACT|nr:MAG: threonylcarbamoyl-AMP synthase [Candidatus Kaiserbacteria bacterium CG10_big_fil_rev_8_21_14_0_10_51_14]
MEILQLSKETIDTCVVRATEVLRAGGVILYPTDTLYGLGADALSDEAVAKVYDIKRRDELKPIHAIVADLEMAERYAEVNDEMRVLERELPKGKITFIVKKKNFNTGIMHGIETFGFRIPDNDFCIALARTFDGPITATSANKAEKVPERSIKAILAQLGDVTSDIDLVIDTGELPSQKPSTVVDMTGDRPLIVREGAIAAPELWNAIHDEY